MVFRTFLATPSVAPRKATKLRCQRKGRQARPSGQGSHFPSANDCQVNMYIYAQMCTHTHAHALTGVTDLGTGKRRGLLESHKRKKPPEKK